MLTLLSALAITWMYQFMGRAPPPTSAELARATVQQENDARDRPITRTARVTTTSRANPASAPAGRTPGWTGLTVGAPSPSGPPSPSPPPVPAVVSPPLPPFGMAAASAPNLGTLTSMAAASGLAQASAGIRTPLPFVPGAEVLETSVEQPAGAGANRTSWSATLSSSQPLAQVAAFYRAQFKQLAGGQNVTLTETSPTAGQLLIAVANTANGSHSAVWMGESDGQVTIRLLRTSP